MPKITDNDEGHLINGTSRSDTIYGNGGWDTINGGAGDDLIYGGGGTDTIHGDGGNDIIRGDHYGATLEDSIGDLLFGDDGNDFISGGPGDDVLWGDDGADEIAGDSGRDLFNDFWGADIMYGGAWRGTGDHERDTFDYDLASGSNSQYGIDFIADFESGVDVIDLRGMDANLTTPVSTDRKGVTTGKESFTFVGDDSRATGAPGELSLTYDPARNETILRAYLDSAPGADFILRIAGTVNFATDIITAPPNSFG
jgi:Ca2+-binding RTX toxin-like protein